MYRKYLYILLVLFYACKPTPKTVSYFKAKDFILVDTTNKANEYLEYTSADNYPIYYIGKLSDTLKIGKNFWLGRTKWIDYFHAVAIRKYSSQNLSIFVDTLVKTNSPLEYLSENETIEDDSTVNYHAYVFTIKNISDSVVYLGRTFSVYFIHREAKDKKGKWIKLDKPLSEFELCGTGQPRIFLKPGEIVLAKLKRYSGTFVTDCRLAFGVDSNFVYSNTFRDTIDERVLGRTVF